jgi:hypothetical protein
MRFFIYLALYLFISALVFFWWAEPYVRRGLWTRREAAIFSLLWIVIPSSYLRVASLNFFVDLRRRAPRPGQPLEEKLGSGPHHADYNKELFPGDKEAGAPAALGALTTEDPVFASLLAQRDDLLREEITVTYAPTGMSRTYAPGTAFPSALRRDWEDGLFKRKNP